MSVKLVKIILLATTIQLPPTLPQPEDCADCGTAASAVELQGFEIQQQEEQQVYSAVGVTRPKQRPKAKIKARSWPDPKGLDWSTSADPLLPTSFHAP